MDEIWQRHKSFIVQCAIGGLVLLIALVVIGNMYSRTEDLQRLNSSAVKDLKAQLDNKKAPNRSSIDKQTAKAKEASQQISSMAAQFASLATGDDYVRENVRWVLATIGQPQAQEERYMGLYKQFPQSALTSLREDAKAVLVARAAQKGRQVDESYGLSAGVQDDEVPGAIHGLAIVCDVVRRALESDGVSAVTDIKVNPRNVLERELGWLSAVEVRVALVGAPADVYAILRGFNRPAPPLNRATVVRSVDSIMRRNQDDDPVKASISLLGVQHKGIE